MSRGYDVSSEIYSLYSHPMTRANSSTEGTDPPLTPLDEPQRLDPYHKGSRSSAQDVAVRIRSTTPESGQFPSREPPLNALPELDEYNPEPYGPYFSLPRDPTQGESPSALTRRGTTKALIGRYESLTPRTEQRPTRSERSDQLQSSRPGSYQAIERKDKGRSPIRQSIRNILSVFKKNKRDRTGTDDPAILEDPQDVHDASTFVSASPSRNSSATQASKLAVRNSGKDFSECKTPLEPERARHSGPLLHLSRSPVPGVHSVWTNCSATLHSTHILVTWHSHHGNPSTEIISFKACTDVRSLSVNDLDPVERGLLPSNTGDHKIFELQFEGRPREKFAASSVPERAKWVSAIWDAILHAQEQRSETSSVVASQAATTVTPTVVAGADRNCAMPAVSRKTSDLTIQSDSQSAKSRMSTVNLDRALPDIPASPAPRLSPPRLSLQIPNSARSPRSPVSGLYPLPKPPVTPNRSGSMLSPSTPTRSQSPSIRNLDQRSMVKQRLAQLEAASSPTTPVRGSAISPVTLTPSRNQSIASRTPTARSTISTTSASIINSYGSPVRSPISPFSGRLTSVASTASTPKTPTNRWAHEAQAGSSLLEPPLEQIDLFSPASKYSSDDVSETCQQPSPGIQLKDEGPVPKIGNSGRPIIRLDTNASSLKPPVIWRSEPRGLPQIPADAAAPSLPQITPNTASQSVPVPGNAANLERTQTAVSSPGIDATSIIDIHTKVNAILEEIYTQRRNQPSHGPDGLDLSAVLERLDMMRSEFMAREADGSVSAANGTEWSETRVKIDQIVGLCQSIQNSHSEPTPSSGLAEVHGQQVEEILSLLKGAQAQWSNQTEQQTDSIRYLNELNTWLEAFVNHGTSQIETVVTGVQQLCKDLGPVMELQDAENGDGDGEPQPAGSLLSDIRRLLVENKGRDEQVTRLHASVNGLIAAVQEDLRRNAEARNMLTTESVVGLIDRQRQDHERMLRSLGTELSNEIRGERLRFVEAMKEATAINVQIHVEEFKKELTREVLLMTQEVGRLQRERQGLEQQIADLFAFYAKQKQAGGLLQQSTRHNVRNQPQPQIRTLSPMSALRLLSTAARRAPKSLASQRRGYAEVSDKIKLSLVLPHQSIFTSTDVVQVNIAAATGDMGILANHVPSIEPLRPGVVEVIESGSASKKWFVSGGFATVHPNNKLTINAVEAASLEDFSPEAVRANLQEALKVAAGNGSEEDKMEARIEADVYEALQHALSTK
ncbi:hypothetical protein WOLCODRAFT_164398 [Wolfiporia cocos MD-104 SS10]|uniref:ATP synthase subunit delta, mitochondrial n=1 Tax=Wolfiporia cocos (strain MD-104) TaxID=742152 RepID=A0A2H3K4M7_WOLCO|nr:hypothetical protein WOLCODRAFT_164398 [Wolfiporia cocos MD-104 SS10]